MSACEKKPNIELKLYDKNWVELEKQSCYDYKKMNEFEYDGKPKGFNGILYMNGAVLIRYDYTGEYNYAEFGLNFSYYSYYEGTKNHEYYSILPSIVEKGEYSIDISIDKQVSSSYRFISENKKEDITRGKLTEHGFSKSSSIISLYKK